MLKQLALIVATLFLLTLLSPMVGASAESDSPPEDFATVGSNASVSESASIPTNSTDSPGGVSPEPGTVTAVYEPPLPVVSVLPGDVIRPILDETDKLYRYRTVAGAYSFEKTSPHIMTYETREGRLLVRAATFVVLDSKISVFLNPKVVDVTAQRYEARYSLAIAANTIGDVTLVYDFREDGPPKITATLNLPAELPLALNWVLLAQDTVASNGTDHVDFASRDVPLVVGTPDYKIRVGPNTNPGTWSRSLSLDWSDARAGVASVGKISVRGLEGPAVIVTFPEDMRVVDPTVVGTSTVVSATDFPMQRKTFEYGGRFWAFWYDGSNIVYASSQMSYANGQNTLAWTAKLSTGSGNLPTGANFRGFDVDHRAGTVLIGWIDSSMMQMMVAAGTVVGSTIAWFLFTSAAYWVPAEAGTPSVAIGSDGYFWTAFVRKGPGTTSLRNIYRSNGPGAALFSLSTSSSLTGPPADSTVRLVALSNGSLISITSTANFRTIVTQRYGAGGWGTSTEWDINLPTAGTRATLLSAVGDEKNNVHIVFKTADSSGGIRFLTLRPNDTLSLTQTIDSALTTSLPTVARDANGELHSFWKYVDGSSNHHIRYSRQLPGSGAWTASSTPWGSVPASVSRGGLTAGPFASGRLALLWTEGAANPFSVQFGSLETPLDLGALAGQPWNRQGLSPYQSYFHQLSEYVSPGSGLLTVKQTDIVLPGRKLDLEITRVYVTPRAFALGTEPSPYLHEEYTNTSLGIGWQLNFPWITSQYLHLWDGQAYVLKWSGNDFENHDGEHFLLRRTPCGAGCFTYALYAKNGIRFQFSASLQLTSIADTYGNSLSFSYTGSRIDYITDSIGRQTSFSYNANGTLNSISTGPLSVTYTYQTVSGRTLLRSVTDGLGRKTLFDHLDGRSTYLITRITHPTGAKSAFTWSNPSVTLGPDLQGFVVTLQDSLNTVGQSVRSNQYDYAFVNGRATYTKITTYDQGIPKASTIQTFDALAGQSTTIRRDAGGNQMGKDVTWFRQGAVAQVDAYPGNAVSPSSSTYAEYDDWGNLVYSRDPIGHERFASFVNTRYQGGFYAPGRLTRTVAGPIFSDDFDDRDLSDWTLDQSAGTVALDYTIFDRAPPGIRIAHSGNPTGVAAATHTFVPQTSAFVLETTIRPEETNKMHYVMLAAGSTVRIYVTLRNNGYISWHDGVTYVDLLPYQAQQWYRVALKVFPSSNTYDIWVNGQLLKNSAALQGSGNIDRVTLQASCGGCGSATVYVDNVKVMKNTFLTLTGLRTNTVVTYTSLEGFNSTAQRVPAGGAVLLDLGPHSFPYGMIGVYDEEGNLEFASSSRIFWGGEEYVYSSPWKAFPARPTKGFLRWTSLYVNDTLPQGANPVPAEDGWNWWYEPTVSPSVFHFSQYLTGAHQHYFGDATAELAISSGQFFIQYIWVPPGQSPSEIMIQFQDTTGVPNAEWAHRAFWGGDLISWGTNNSNSRRFMGGLPSGTGRWLQLVAKANDVGMNGLTIEGWSYTLYGGQAFWDYSAIGGSDFGEIRVSGLSGSMIVDLYDPKGTLVRSATVPSGQNTALIDVYAATNPVRAFPFDGYFIVKDAAAVPVYRSPVLTFWGGDTYNYATTDFYANANVDPTIHDRPACTLEYQTGRSATPLVPIKACVRYNPKGLPDLSKVWDGTAWRESTYSYDATYGLLTSVRDAKLNNVSFKYSPTYGQAYITKSSDDFGTIGRYTYDRSTGWPSASIDGRGYLSRSEYDLVGRRTVESRYDLPSASEVLYHDMEWTTEETVPKMEDLSGDGNHGTIYGAADARGVVGRGREFDGVDDSIQGPSIHPGNSFTVAAWVFDKSGGFGERMIVGRINSYFLWIDNGRLRGEFYSGAAWVGQVSYEGFSAAFGNRWTHVSIVKNQTAGTFRLYVDGRWIMTDPDSGTVYDSGVLTAVGDAPGWNRRFQGTIDEVRIFDRALGDPEVQSLSNRTYGRLTSSQIAYDDVGNSVTFYEPTIKPRLVHLDMETFLNGKVEDLAGRGHHATMSGTVWATGRVGAARAFDGDDFLTIDAAQDLNTPAFTAALWVRRDAWTTTTLRPTANGGTVQWVRSGCSANWDCVNEATSDGDTTRVASSILGQVDLYQLGNLPGGTSTISSVTVTAKARVPNVPPCEAPPCWGNIRLRVNGFESPPLAVDEGSAYNDVSSTWTTNPGTGQPWTEAEVNALEAGVKLDSTNWNVRVTQVYVTVSHAGGGFTTNAGLVGKDSFANTWRIWARTDGKIEADAKNDAVGNLVSQTIGSAGTWYHVALTFDGGTGRLYVNGVEEASAPTADWGGAYNSVLRIGDTDSTSPFVGILDEVQVFDRALSAGEVAELYGGTERGFYEKAYFDVLGRTTRTVRRDLFQTSVSWQTALYNFREQVVSTTIARSSSSSFTTTYAYDFLGRPTTATYPDFPSNPATMSYDDVNRIRTVVAENGRKVQYLYDLAGRTTATREYYDATNYHATWYAYDEVGNLRSVTNALNQVTTHEYDPLNRLTKTIYPTTSYYEAYTYDEVGNLKTRRDRLGQTTTYNYDNRYRLGSVTVNDPGTGTDVSYAYDLNDNPTSIVRDPANPIATVALTYDGLDRVFNEATTVGGTSYTVNYAYDPSGRLTRLTYPDSTAVEYTYDAVGRTLTAKQATTTYGIFSYYADDLLKDVTFGNQITQAYLYNGRGWPTSIKAMYQTTTYLDLPYAYDASGNVLTMGSSAFTYDRMDRLKTAIGGFGSHFYDYDAVGNRKRVDAVFLRPNAAGSSTQWTKSGSGGANWDRVDEVTNDGESTYVYTSTVGNKDLYALADNTVAGTIGAVTVTAVARAVSSSCEPNCYGVIKLRIGGSATDASPVRNVGTAYETVSHTWTTKPGGGAWTDADLDSLQAGIELVSGGSATTVRVAQVFVSVSVGASSVSYTYSDGLTGMNTLTSLVKNGVTTSFTYDANGNLITKTGGWNYLWNSENLMTLAKLSGVQQQAYTYDGLGRRVKVDGTSPSTWTVSIFSGMDAIYEKDQAGSVTKYVYANGMRIAKITPSGGVHYFLADHLGSTRKILDAARVEQYAVEYEPFGKPYSTSGPQPDKHKFTMEKHDDPTGFVYLRARQYDPEIGRFVGADPVLGALGNPQTLNRYAYVVNNPLTYTDPTGELFVIAAIMVIGVFTCVIWWCTSPFGSDDFWFGLSITPGLDVVGDAGFAINDCTRAWNNPDWGTVGTCALDVGLALLPFVGVGMVKAGGRALGRLPWGKADDVPLRPIDNAGPRPPRLTVEDVMRNPDILKPSPGRLVNQAGASDLIADANSKGWRVTTLGEGSQQGRGLKMLGPHDGQTIRYHPGGGHHGTYWYVASGTIGSAWVHPWWTIWVKRAG